MRSRGGSFGVARVRLTDLAPGRSGLARCKSRRAFGLRWRGASGSWSGPASSFLFGLRAGTGWCLDKTSRRDWRLLAQTLCREVADGAQDFAPGWLAFCPDSAPGLPTSHQTFDRADASLTRSPSQHFRCCIHSRPRPYVEEASPFTQRLAGLVSFGWTTHPGWLGRVWPWVGRKCRQLCLPARSFVGACGVLLSVGPGEVCKTNAGVP